MTFGGRKALTLLFVGDVVVFAFSLWLTLAVRSLVLPGPSMLVPYAVPFGLLFVAWVIIFYISGLYGKPFILFRSQVPRALVRTQFVNIVVAALLFFFVPEFGITPKTILAIYLCISLGLIYAWRLGLFPRFTLPIARERTALVGCGTEVDELVREVNGNPRYHLEFVARVDPAALAGTDAAEFARTLACERVTLVVVDTNHPSAAAVLPLVYDLVFMQQQCQYADFYSMYEEVFDRMPLSLLRHDWFLANIQSDTALLYAAVKRTIDIVGALVMGLITLIVLPFVFVALRLEGPGALFLRQVRLGKNGTRVSAYKFRTMAYDDSASREWVTEGRKNYVTKVGNVLRQTSLDEFPQCINIFTGELSLIGPRNDIEGLGLRLAEAIPYYNIRYMVKPGITGWAQINQQYEQGNISPQSVEETRVRLAYDFYYIKNRSLALDFVIALKTIKRMLFRVSAW